MSGKRSVGNDQPPWTVVKVENAGDGSQRYVYHDDGSLTAWGYAPTKWTSKFTGKTDVKRITGFRLEMLTDPNLPLNGPGRSPLGLFALSEFMVEVADPKKPDKTTRVKLVSATADFGNEREATGGDVRRQDRQEARDRPGVVRHRRQGRHRLGHRRGTGPAQCGSQGRVRCRTSRSNFPTARSSRSNSNRCTAAGTATTIRTTTSAAFASRSRAPRIPSPILLPKHIRDIFACHRTRARRHRLRLSSRIGEPRSPTGRKRTATIEELWKQHPVGASQLTMGARPTPRTTFILQRGDFLKPDRPVTPGVPAALHPLPADAPANRLGLAKWLVARDSPTTARAIVNRVWQAYFGTGLVATSEDFGIQGEPPSHPELLDWLAVEFMENGWSLKHLHRLIVTSAAYRQSSKVTPELLRLDPSNRLLARGPRFRVEGEVVRDIALAASGLLNPELGGPPVYPPAPDFLFKPPASYGPKTWIESKGAERYRRALYTFRFRSVPYPVLTNFDTPNGDASCVRRARSNTPLQALTTLNETLFLECARGLALKTLAEGGSGDRDRAVYAFRRCTGRKPNDKELAVLLSFLAKQTEKFSGADAKPWDLAANDPAHPPTLPKGVTPAQAAAWTALSRLLLNLDETITKD